MKTLKLMTLIYVHFLYHLLYLYELYVRHFLIGAFIRNSPIIFHKIKKFSIIQTACNEQYLLFSQS
jgi:hypothetical protein